MPDWLAGISHGAVQYSLGNNGTCPGASARFSVLHPFTWVTGEGGRPGIRWCGFQSVAASCFLIEFAQNVRQSPSSDVCAWAPGS